MKKELCLLILLSITLFACNNESKDSVELADSANKAKMDTVADRPIINSDEESVSFLVKAANGGMAEVQTGNVAVNKAMNQRVKDFGSMMVHDHSAANDQVKTLAAQRNVTLPDSISNEKKKEMDDLVKKTGQNFDKAYMKMMVKDHETDIDLFAKASDKVNDPEVKMFIDNTLPKLRMHLDSAKAIQKMLK